jgi:hypothetical protein
MKQSAFVTILRSTLIPAFAIAVCAPTLPARAQTGSSVGTVSVPFAFYLDNQEMPAGVYSIDHQASTLFLLRGPIRSGMMLTHPVSTNRVAHRGSVAFLRIDSTYFLEGICPGSETDGTECFAGPTEKKPTHESNQQVPSVTTLAFNSGPRH